MKRDEYGIIGQTDKDNPDYFDCGDSAFSTGLMVFCGSLQDIQLMSLFVTSDHKIVRHPYQSANTGTHPHNDTRSVSRDQVIAFFAGLKYCGDEDVKKACLNYAKGWRVNRDILGPAHKYYLYKLAGVEPSLTLTVFAEMHQGLALLWDCFIKPDSEKNQSVVMNSIFGKRWIKFLYYNHPDLYKNIDVYFNGWRDKAEIGAGLKCRIGKEIFKMTNPDFAELKEKLCEFDEVDSAFNFEQIFKNIVENNKDYEPPCPAVILNAWFRQGKLNHKHQTSPIITELLDIIQSQSEVMETYHDIHYAPKLDECLSETNTRLQKLRDGK